MRKPILFLAALCAALLAACGGSGGRGTPPAPEPAPVDVFFAQVRDIAATAPDDTEPASVDAVGPTTPDDTEPVALL